MNRKWRFYQKHPTFRAYCEGSIPTLKENEMPVWLLLIPTADMKEFNNPALLNTVEGKAYSISRGAARQIILTDTFDPNAMTRSEMYEEAKPQQDPI